MKVLQSCRNHFPLKVPYAPSEGTAVYVLMTKLIYCRSKLKRSWLSIILLFCHLTWKAMDRWTDGQLAMRDNTWLTMIQHDCFPLLPARKRWHRMKWSSFVGGVILLCDQMRSYRTNMFKGLMKDLRMHKCISELDCFCWTVIHVRWVKTSHIHLLLLPWQQMIKCYQASVLTCRLSVQTQMCGHCLTDASSLIAFPLSTTVKLRADGIGLYSVV